MHRRFAPLFLAVLIALPVVVPVTAAEPAASPPAAPSDAPPTLPPAVDPTTEPTPGPTTDPTPTPTIEPDTSQAPDAAIGGVATVADPAPGTAKAPVLPDATGRYIVMLRSGADTAAVVDKAHKRDGVKADHSFGRAMRGFSAKLDKKQKSDLQADPNVIAVVPDGIISMTQTTPTGVSRVGGALSKIAVIDGTDQRVDADVAIVDTGITPVPDLNVAGGHNCSTSDPNAWHDNNNHGTHVAGTVAALDNSFGVVGIAPGARVWAVKILNADGYGLISWYVCGLDWILAQRDPNDASRPLFEAVNMSVTKNGSDDHNCGLTNHDVLHQAICRVVAGGITVVAAAANDHHNAAANIPASYDEVITVSALADTDGKPGGLGGNRCFSWGGYDKDDTFADFSNYGPDVDIMAPGKCILSTIPGPGYAYMSGTSMAAPTVTGAVALYKSSRPDATPADVREALRYLGNLNWKTSTDPDSIHEPLLDVSRIGPLGTFTLTPASTPKNVEAGTTATVPFTIGRSSTFFERVQLAVTSVPDGWTAAATPTSLMGWTADAGAISVTIPSGTPLGSYEIGITGTNQGRTVTATLAVNVVQDDPTAQAPMTYLVPATQMGLTTMTVRLAWSAATDPTSSIAGYELESSKSGGAWTAAIGRTAAQHDATLVVSMDTTYRFRLRAVDAAGNLSPWVEGLFPTVVHPVDDRSTVLVGHGTWARNSSATAWRTTVSGSSKAGTSLTLRFTGHGVAIVGPKNPQRGKVRVYIDGVYRTTISMYSRAWTSRQVVLSGSFPYGGRHSITVQVVGGGSHPLFRLDAFVVVK